MSKSCAFQKSSNTKPCTNVELYPASTTASKTQDFAALHSSSQISHEEPSTFVPAVQRHTVAPRETKI